MADQFEGTRQLTAYRLGKAVSQPAPAPARRSWMDKSRNRFANRCLPLLTANQAGWLIPNPHAVMAVWNGGPEIADIQVTFALDVGDAAVRSHFGHGILTWHIKFLFRTPPGYNLLVRGPANMKRPYFAELCLPYPVRHVVGPTIFATDDEIIAEALSAIDRNPNDGSAHLR